ncbi:mitochondrial ribosomal protein S17 [Rhynchophorus ferrugineus]|uniref:Uncharacterized protein n=1 Tax=Rhynchophorus ferrugineus TaxID=354439 RepID=A0A834I7N0_RHYFE|nr:hypothetical protein GWI33_012856 [Rhynchophorus ferrugineus]
MSLPSLRKTSLLLGVCVPSLKKEASKFKIKRLELDPHLKMYFSKHEFIYAHDPNKQCKTGDIVLIESLRESLTKLISHRVKEIIYPYGDVTCPLTNKKVVGSKYREHIDAINKIYGERPGAFKYGEAPPRGWQEDKKDFSHAETYIKYHEDGTEQPYAV